MRLDSLFLWLQSAVGLELWSMSDDILFDNFIVTDDKEVADKWAKDSFELKKAQELAGSGSAVSTESANQDNASAV